MITENYGVGRPVGAIRLNPWWSRGFGGSPPGYKFCIQYGPLSWKPNHIKRMLMNEIMDALTSKQMLVAYSIHVLQHVGVSEEDQSRIVVVTLDSVVPAFAAYNAAMLWDAPCPVHVDPERFHRVICSWIVALPRCGRHQRIHT